MGLEAIWRSERGDEAVATLSTMGKHLSLSFEADEQISAVSRLLDRAVKLREESGKFRQALIDLKLALTHAKIKV